MAKEGEQTHAFKSPHSQTPTKRMGNLLFLRKKAHRRWEKRKY